MVLKNKWEECNFVCIFPSHKEKSKSNEYHSNKSTETTRKKKLPIIHLGINIFVSALVNSGVIFEI